MDRYLVAAGLFALAGAVLVSTFVSPAYAQSAGYNTCVVLKTDFVNEASELDESKLLKLPAGWTALGGGAVPKGMQYVGVIVVCK